MDSAEHSTNGPSLPAAHQALWPQLETDKVNQLTRLLKQFYGCSGHINFTKAQRDFIAARNPSDFAFAAQNLLVSGFTINDLERLYERYVEIFPDQAGKARISLPAGHILRKVFCEHEMLLCFLADIEEVNHALRPLAILSDTSTEFRKLAHASSHLTKVYLHNEREDDIIFPELARLGWSNLTAGFQTEHSYIYGAVQSIEGLVETFGLTDLLEFRKRLQRAIKYLVPAMQEHIFKEEHILYPIALDVIGDRRIWDRIKALCDEIGYCCFNCD